MHVDKFPFTTLKIPATKKEVNLHYERLVKTSIEVGIPFTYTQNEFVKLINEQKHPDNILKLINNGKSLEIHSRQYNNKAIEVLTLKTKLVPNEWGNLKLYPNDYQIKLLDEAKSLLYDDFLFIDAENDTHDQNIKVLETTIANVFIIKNGQFYTPTLTSKILNGTIRQILIKYFGAIETDISLKKLKKADCVFVTNSIKKIAIIKKVDEQHLEINAEVINKLTMIKKQIEEM